MGFQVPRRETWFLCSYRLDRLARGRLKEEEAKEEGAENYEFRYVPTNLLGDDGKLYEVRHKYYECFDQDGGIYGEVAMPLRRVHAARARRSQRTLMRRLKTNLHRSE